MRRHEFQILVKTQINARKKTVTQNYYHDYRACCDSV